ncbi:MAG: hypothetical protein AAGI72_23490 [Pseudomonadota bacterium]
MSKAIEDIAAERKRQIEQERWTPEHDDSHDGGELCAAAACYAATAASKQLYSSSDDTAIAITILTGRIWPWGNRWWKPGTVRRMLVKAGALIVAEIERLDRAAAADAPPVEGE